MRPYIESINKNKYLGDIVHEYGEIRWGNGFVLGFCCGTVFGMSILFVTKCFKK
jgi:hypothetical protein